MKQIGIIFLSIALIGVIVGTLVYIVSFCFNMELIGLLGAFFIVSGMAFLVLGAILMIIDIFFVSKGVKSRDLSNKGEKILAEYQGMERTCLRLMTISGTHVIVCKGFYQGKEYTFRSEPLSYNPKEIIERKNITNFPVYLDKNDPRKYYMSLDELK
ncbi:MAG: hypothetical protein IJN50_05890 [Clostridia bacterium]|nr:hypothetical protein [Clostridia bacterium]